MVKGERVGKRERWKTTEDLPGEKTYRDLLARERDGSPLSIFRGRRPIEIFWRGRETEVRCRSSRGEDLERSSGEGERWKTVVDLPGEKTYADLLARERDGRPLSIFQGRRPRQIFWRGIEMKDRCRSSRGEDLERSSGER